MGTPQKEFLFYKKSQQFFFFLFSKQFKYSFPDFKMVIDDIFGEKNKVLVKWTASGTFLHTLNNIEPTFKKLLYSGVWIGKFDKNEKLVEGFGSFDSFHFLSQLGLIDK